MQASDRAPELRASVTSTNGTSLSDSSPGCGFETLGVSATVSMIAIRGVA
jgi:hypothetical protein